MKKKYLMTSKIPVLRYLQNIKHEARISYFCTQAARKQLTLEVETELMGYVALDQESLRLITIERLLFIMK